jgi:polysaccharide export outer membrane protein
MVGQGEYIMMCRWILTVSASACLIASGCASSEAGLPALSTTAPSGYHLGPGDQLRVSVSGLDAMNNTYLVDDTGAIAVPMLDPIVVSGKTIRETEAAIADKIRARQIVLDPRVSAQVIAYRPFFIAGEVQKPGQYPYVPGMSLMTAVSVAGGYTFRANTKKATITRAAVKASATQDTRVLPGDLIVVRESWF